VVVTPFDKWALDFVGPIKPSSNGKSYILVYMNYVTKWVKAQLMKHVKENKVVEFPYMVIFKKFGVPREIITG
jgi:hypothetical protein